MEAKEIGGRYVPWPWLEMRRKWRQKVNWKWILESREKESKQSGNGFLNREREREIIIVLEELSLLTTFTGHSDLPVPVFYEEQSPTYVTHEVWHMPAFDCLMWVSIKVLCQSIKDWHVTSLLFSNEKLIDVSCT